MEDQKIELLTSLLGLLQLHKSDTLESKQRDSIRSPRKQNLISEKKELLSRIKLLQRRADTVKTKFIDSKLLLYEVKDKKQEAKMQSSQTIKWKVLFLLITGPWKPQQA